MIVLFTGPGCTGTDLDQPSDTAPEVQLATGAELRQVLSGSTLDGTWIDNSRFAEFYSGDGRFRGYAYAPHRSKYVGTWTIRGDLVCTRWTLDRTGQSQSQCLGAVIEGDRLSFYKNGQPLGVSVRVRPGNPNGF